MNVKCIRNDHRHEVEVPDDPSHELPCPDCGSRLAVDLDPPHEGHFSRLGGTWWCDTCNSPYCELA